MTQSYEPEPGSLLRATELVGIRCLHRLHNLNLVRGDVMLVVGVDRPRDGGGELNKMKYTVLFGGETHEFEWWWDYREGAMNCYFEVLDGQS